MGKKRSRSKYISKGQRNNIAKVGLVRSEYDKSMDLLTAWRSGKNPWVTYPNPEKGTNRPMIKVRANDLWGSYKNIFPNIFSRKASIQREMKMKESRR